MDWFWPFLMWPQTQEQFVPENRTDGKDGAMKAMTAKNRASFARVIHDGIEQAIASAETSPQPNYTLTKFAEEAGELVRAGVHASEGRASVVHVRREMVDVVAAMFRLWCEGDEIHGLPSVAESDNDEF
jgi:hypothetical protein